MFTRPGRVLSFFQAKPPSSPLGFRMARFVSVQTQPPSAESAEEPKGQTVWGAEVLPFGASEYMGMGNMGHTKKPIGYGSSSFTSESLRMIKHSFTLVPPGDSDISEGFYEDLEGFIETNFEDRNPIPVPDFEYLVAHST